MKKLLKLAGAICASLLIHSCQKDDLIVNPENGSAQTQDKPTGYIPSTPEQLEQIKEWKSTHPYSKEVIPSKFVLPELPAALSQGYKGSCVAYAIAHARTVISGENKALSNGSPNYTAYASGDYLYEKYKYNKTSCSNGVFFIEALDALKTEGTTTYDDMGLVACGVLPTATQEKNAIKNRINDYYRLTSPTGGIPTLEDIKEQIAKGKPVVIGIAVDNNFTSNSIRLWDINTSAFYGNHAVVLTGYDNDKQAFRLLNSWGPNWGEKGYVWATYKKIQSVLGADAFVMERDNTLTYQSASFPNILIKKNNNYLDNISFLFDQSKAFMSNGAFNWNNSSAKPYYDQYSNPILDLTYWTTPNEGFDIAGDITIEIRVKIESSKSNSYPANTQKGIMIELWNGAYAKKDQIMSCNIPISGTGGETIFKNNSGEIANYVAYNFFNGATLSNPFSNYKTIRVKLKNGQFYLGDSGYKLPSGINRLRTFDVQFIGTIGSVSDIRFYKNGKQIGIDTFDSNVPWLQWFE